MVSGTSTLHGEESMSTVAELGWRHARMHFEEFGKCRLVGEIEPGNDLFD